MTRARAVLLCAAITGLIVVASLLLTEWAAG